MMRGLIWATALLCLGVCSTVTQAAVSVSESGDLITVKTASAKYTFDKPGGGFRFIHDNDNNDWIGTGHGSNYQGIPNLVYPADYFHPYRKNCDAEVKSKSSTKAVIRTWTKSDNWEIEWEFFDTYAKMNLKKKGSQKYWFLYEGEPGGKNLDSKTFWMNSAHGKQGMSTYAKDLPKPEWVAFGHESVKRVLFLLHYEDDGYEDHNRGGGCCSGMTVFGFGRDKGTGKYLTKAPQTFAIGFLETTDYTKVKAAVEAIHKGDAVAIKNASLSQPAAALPGINYNKPVSVYDISGKLIYSGMWNAAAIQPKMGVCFVRQASATSSIVRRIEIR